MCNCECNKTSGKGIPASGLSPVMGDGAFMGLVIFSTIAFGGMIVKIIIDAIGGM